MLCHPELLPLHCSVIQFRNLLPNRMAAFSFVLIENISKVVKKMCFISKLFRKNKPKNLESIDLKEYRGRCWQKAFK